MLESTILAWILSILAVGALLLLPIKLRLRWNQIDFSAFYVWSVALHRGLNPYTARLGALAGTLGMNLDIFDRANYPAPFLLCFLPFSYLPPRAAYIVWTAIQYLALFALLYLLIGKERRLRPASRASLISLAIIFSPLFDNFTHAQLQVMILLGFVAMHRCLVRNAQAAAGLLLAFLALVKLYPIVMIGYLLVRRKWRAVAWTVCGVIAGTLVAWFALRSILEFAAPAGATVAESPLVVPSWSSVSAGASYAVSLLIHERGFLSLSDQIVRLVHSVDPGASDQVIRLTIILGLGLALLITIGVTLKANRFWNDDLAAFAVWVAVTPLITHAYQNYGVFLLMPFSLIAMSVVLDESFAGIAGWLALAAYLLANLMFVVPDSLIHPVLAVFKELLTIGFAAACFYALSVGKNRVAVESL